VIAVRNGVALRQKKPGAPLAEATGVAARDD